MDNLNGKSEIFNYIHSHLEHANYSQSTIKYMFAAIISNTPVLLLGPPGTGKTRIVETIVQLFDGINMSRVQGHEELGYTDLTGRIDIVKMNKGEHGTLWNHDWIDANVNFVDELNRMTKLSQNALLTQLAEKRVIRSPGEEVKKADSWFVFTANYEDNSTFGIMEPLLDRIGISIQMGHPTMDQFINSASEYNDIIKTTIGDIESWQDLMTKISVSYALELEVKTKIRMTSICIYSENSDKADIDQDSLCNSCPYRFHPCSFIDGEGAGWRAASHTITMAKAFAIIDNRKEVDKNDISEALKIVLYHRFYGSFSDRMSEWFDKKNKDIPFEIMPNSYKINKLMETFDKIYKKDISYIAKAFCNLKNKEELNIELLNRIQDTASGMSDKENRSNVNPVAIELANTVVESLSKKIDADN